VEGTGLRGNSLILILNELIKLTRAALRSAQAGDRQELCEISERLLSLQIRFAAEYRHMLASQPAIIPA
jgi:hypothetical protein